jgi:hypothetical protein
MASETQARSNGELSQGLPPVTPPSGKFIVQLFLVPGLIVVGILAVLIPIVVWQSRPYRAEVLLEDLRSGNADVRWRAAERLAQMLPRDSKEAAPRFAFDSKFALDLAEELRSAIKVEEEMLGRIGGKSREDLPKDHKELEAQQNLIRFLCGSLGHFNVPVTAPMLGEIAARPASAANPVALERQQIAILALANLGDNLKYFHKQPEERQKAILDQLESQAEGTGDRRKAAEATLAFLKYQTPMGVEEVLATCSKSEYAAVRELAALAFSFWDVGLAEQTLIELTNDDGRGAEPGDQQPFYQTQIRYLAVVALARHGSELFEKHPDWINTLAEMLDRERQTKLNRTTVRGKEVVDQNRITETMNTALKAATELHHLRPQLNLSALKPALLGLANEPSETLKEEAGALLNDLNKPS